MEKTSLQTSRQLFQIDGLDVKKAPLGFIYFTLDSKAHLYNIFNIELTFRLGFALFVNEWNTANQKLVLNW